MIESEIRNYYCDKMKCDVADLAKTRSGNDRDYYVNILHFTAYQSIWVRSFLSSVLLTFFTYIWFEKKLPNFFSFIIVVGVFFIVIYFIQILYQNHLSIPINQDMRGYILSSCTKDDQRDVQINMSEDVLAYITHPDDY